MPALFEARKTGIPTIALMDTNMDPRIVTYPIFGNDDAVSGVEFVAMRLAEAAREGLEVRTSTIRQAHERSDKKKQQQASYEAEIEEGVEQPNY